MDVIELSPSEEKCDKNLQPEDNGHTETMEFAWNIDEEGEEDGKEDEECIVIAVKAKENRHIVDIPRYKSKFTGYLTEKEFSMETGQLIKNGSGPKRTCFNCLGDHNISDCKMKKDYQAIARNKTTILGKKPSNVRYHEDGENKFSNFGPGVLSKNLVAALGLNDSQPPDFIYRMRILGYPPGWLKEAEVQRSTVSLIDGSGKPISHPDDEEGETDVCLTKYQPEKFISFPGFNVPFPEHIVDEGSDLNYPPMQTHHLRKNFLKFMKLNKADLSKRKKKLKEGALAANPGDMDVDDSATVNTAIELNESTSEAVKGREEGEISSDSNDSKGISELESNSVESPCLSKEVSLLKRTLDCDSSSDSSSALKRTVKRHHRSTSKGFMLGVCIPDSITPFDALPEATKWSVNVSDHILFDNLPDSLGTWQKMKGIVKTVQEKFQKLHATDDDS